MAAIKTILVADLVMSLDNVIAVAAAAKGNTTLLVIGLAVSIPLIVFGSTLLLKVMERFPIIITLGAALLGWVAGEMAITDPVDQGLGRRAARHSCTAAHRRSRARSAWSSSASGWPRARWRARAAARGRRSPRTRRARLQRVLLAVDGSEGAAHAVRHLIALREDLREPAALDVHLINVQRPVSGDVSRFVAGETLEDYHRERSEQALAPARALLDAAGLAHQEHRRVGDPAPTRRC